MRCLILLSALLVASFAFLLGFKPKKWNDLRVRWGPNPFNGEFYVSQPRIAVEAEEQGFKKISDCDVQATWRGARYVKDDDYSLVLLYDVNGYIAGIQTTVAKNFTVQPAFIDNGDHWLITAYFVDPSIICTSGRSASDFENEGTGNNLYIQESADPESSTLIPKKESDIGSTLWTKGQCFLTMGQHYWYNLSDDMDCDAFFPVFLLYNKGFLNGFGWAINGDLPEERWEHPPTKVLPMFFKSVPTCVAAVETRSTLHIYMNRNPITNFC